MRLSPAIRFALAVSLLASCGRSDSPTAPDVTPPTVAITSPAAGPVSGIVVLEATASDDRRVTAVSFRVNGSAVIAVDSVAPFTYSWDADSYAIGAYVWQATASDKAGNTSSSVGVQYNVGP